MQMMDMYIEAEKEVKSRRTAKIIRTVGIVVWIVMILVSILLTSRSLIIIN